MSFPTSTQFTPCEIATKTANATDATAEYVEITMPRVVTYAMAQVQAVTTGVVNNTGLAVTITTVAGTSCKVKVAVTALSEGDKVIVVAV